MGAKLLTVVQYFLSTGGTVITTVIRASLRCPVKAVGHITPLEVHLRIMVGHNELVGFKYKVLWLPD